MTGYYNTFVVRIWCDEAGKPARGHIQHTGTREHAYFNRLEDMNEFIRKHPGQPPNGSTGKQGGEGDIKEIEIVKLKKINVQRRKK